VTAEARQVESFVIRRHLWFGQSASLRFRPHRCPKMRAPLWAGLLGNSISSLCDSFHLKPVTQVSFQSAAPLTKIIAFPLFEIQEMSRRKPTNALQPMASMSQLLAHSAVRAKEHRSFHFLYFRGSRNDLNQSRAEFSSALNEIDLFISWPAPLDASARIVERKLSRHSKALARINKFVRITPD
jgi:hypothetical protein